MNDPQQPDGDLELLRRRLQAAEANYRTAKAEHERLADITAALGASHPDGSLALKRAVELDRSTLDAYRRAVRELTDFIVAHQLPFDKLPRE